MSPFHPSSQTHLASRQYVSLHSASQVPWPLQCSLFVPSAVEHAHKLHAASQSFHLRKSLQLDFLSWWKHEAATGSLSLVLVHFPMTYFWNKGKMLDLNILINWLITYFLFKFFLYQPLKQFGPQIPQFPCPVIWVPVESTFVEHQ